MHLQQSRRSRRLGLEALEPRQMLSASPVAFNLPGLNHDDTDHDHGRMPPGLESVHQTHWIDGALFEFVADPTFADGHNTESSVTATSEALHSLTSIPQLHSNSGAPATIYLDFDGHYQAVWGSYTNATTPVYDIDGDRTTFSDAELSQIVATWQAVAEDFAPFNIDVTTVEPLELAAGVPESVADGKALRIAIGGSWQDWFGSSASGVAYINSFTNSIANVVYVFSENARRPLWDVASHEAGHGFGLAHQSVYDVNGVKLEEYNSGTSVWLPLMGFSENPSVTTTWYNGTPSSSPNLRQDDMAVIARAENGFGFRADDHADTAVGATPLATDGVTWSGNGIIETNTDVDVFSFTISTEDVYRLASNVAAVAPNLDIVMELRDTSGQLLAAAAPFDSKGAEIVQNLLPGGYFLSVLKTAAYGWVGQYTMAIDAPEAAVLVTPTSNPLTTSEAGAAASFTVQLSTAPTADVEISVSSSNSAEGIASTASLIFTPGNWSVPQTVTITGHDDAVPDGDTSYTIVLGPAASADPRFDGLNPTDVSVSNLDNDIKYYVVDDGSPDRSYRYLSDGSASGSTNLASGNSAPRGVASSAGSNKTWVINSNRVVYVYDTAGSLLGLWSAGSMPNNASPEGIATDGTDLWIVDARSDKVYRYAGAASRISGSQNAASSFSLAYGNTAPKDIVTEGTSIWVVNNSTFDAVFKYSLAGGLIGSWTIDPANASPTGIAIDPANDNNLLILDSGTDRIYQYAGASSRTSGSQSAAKSFALASGNANPQGFFTVSVPPPQAVYIADLAVSSTAVSSTTEGDLVTFNIVVRNNSVPSATDVVLTDALGSNWAFDSASTSQGIVQQSSGVVTINIGTMTYGSTVTAQVRVRATEAGSLTNSVSVAASSSDPNLADNTAANTVNVVAAPIIVSGSPVTLSGKKQNNVTTATFTHASGVHPASYYTATINWGDGTTSAGSITQSGTTYAVKGSHTYPTNGPYTVTTTVVRASGGSSGAPTALVLASGRTEDSASSVPASTPGHTAAAAMALPSRLPSPSVEKEVAKGMVILAREQVFESFPPERNYVPAKRPSSTASASRHQDRELPDCATSDIVALELTVDAALMKMAET